MDVVGWTTASTRLVRGLANYYRPEPTGDDEDAEHRRRTAPGSALGVAASPLTGEVERRDLVPLLAKGVRPVGGSRVQGSSA